MSFQPTQTPRKARTSLVVAVASTVVVAIIAVVLLSRGGDDDDTAATSTTTASSETTGTGAGTETSVAGPTVSGISPTSLPPISNGGPETVSGQVTITGTPLAQFPESGADKAVGQTFPDMSGVKVTDSSPLSITNDGRPKVVLFVAHWCPHCQKEVPLLTKWIAANGMPESVDLYAVSTGVVADRGNYPPADWLKREQWPVPTLADDTKGSAFAAAGLTGFPSFVAIGADGTVKQRASGELTTQQFEQLLAVAAR